MRIGDRIKRFPTMVIKIYGNVSTGKTAYAKRIEKMAKNEGLSFYCSDHDLFTFDKNFKDNLFEIETFIKEKDFNIAVISIGTGSKGKNPFILELENGYDAIRFHDLFLGYINYQKGE